MPTITPAGPLPHRTRAPEFKKHTLLRMARAGMKRPSQCESDLKLKQLGIALTNYTVGPASDPGFYVEIRKIRPEWFGTIWPTYKRKIIERDLLSLAKSGAPKPTGPGLGQSFSSYKSPNNKRFNPGLIKKILEIQPTWFVSPTDVVKERKIHLITMANLGEPRPVSWSENENERDWARYLSRYMSHDPHFKKLMEEIPSDWFIPNPVKKQIILLEMAARGFERPPENTVLGNALSRYISPSRNVPVFSEHVRKIRPDWFPGKGSNQQTQSL